MSRDADQARHLPTQSGIQRARATGNIPLSRDLASCLAWLGCLVILMSLGSQLWLGLTTLARRCWSNAGGDSAASVLQSTSLLTGDMFWRSLLPVLGGFVLAAWLSFAAQTRFGFFSERVAADFSRVNPAKNLREAFSPIRWSAAIGGLLKLAGLSVLAWWIVTGDLVGLISLSGRPLDVGLGNTGAWLTGVLVKLCAAACLVGAADFGIRFWYHRRQLRLTDQEIVDAITFIRTLLVDADAVAAEASGESP